MRLPPVFIVPAPPPLTSLQAGLKHTVRKNTREDLLGFVDQLTPVDRIPSEEEAGRGVTWADF
jgi:hypothetical protein